MSSTHAIPTDEKKPPPRVCIGLPVRNGGEQLRQAIQSVLDQTLEDFELLVCDNASDDDTREIVHAFREADSRVRYFRQLQNVGPAANFVTSFELCDDRSPYFMWLAHDDYLDSTHLEACCRVLDKQPEVVLASGWCRSIPVGAGRKEFVDKGLSTTGLEPTVAFKRLRRFLYDPNYAGGLFYGVMRRATMNALHPIPNTWAGDHIYLVELGLHGSLYTVPQLQIHKRRGGTGSSMAKILRVYGITNPLLLYLPVLTQEAAFQRAIWQSPRLTPTEKIHLVLWSLGMYLYRLVRKRFYKRFIKRLIAAIRDRWLGRTTGAAG